MRFLLFVLVFGFTIPAKATIPADQVSALLDTTQSIRASGIGGAFVCQADDVLSFSSNSAGIGQLLTAYLAVGLDSEQQVLGGAAPVGRSSSVSGGIWLQGERRIGGGGIGWRIEDSNHNLLLFGMGFRGFTQPDVLEGLVFDTGFLARPVGGRVAVGAALQNIGPKVRWQGQTESLPLNWRAGASYVASVKNPLLFSSEISRRRDERLRVKLGVEVGILSSLFARVGYHVQVQEESRWAAGLGWQWRGLGVDYAWSQKQADEANHRVQIQYAFGGQAFPASWALVQQQALLTPTPPTVPSDRISPGDGLTRPGSVASSAPPQDTSLEIAAIPERISSQNAVLVHLLSPPVSDVLRWELQVRDALQRIKRHYGAVGHPPRMLTWDALGNDGSVVAPGDYYMQLVFAQSGGGTLGSNVVRIDVEGKVPKPSESSPPPSENASSLPQLSVTCVPMMFTPDQDGEDDTAAFSVLSEMPHTLDNWNFHLSVHTPTGATVATFPVESIPTRITWDGDDNRGQPLPMGHYAFWIEGEHPSGRHYAAPPQIVTISEREHIIERIVIAADVLFQLDTAEIQPSALDSLQSAARAIRTHPTAEIRIEGHADDSGDEAANMKLSAERAAQVFTYLVEQKSIPAFRLSMAGYGRLRPMDEEDAQLNRRVEIIITTNEQGIGY